MYGERDPRFRFLGPSLGLKTVQQKTVMSCLQVHFFTFQTPSNGPSASSQLAMASNPLSSGLHFDPKVFSRWRPPLPPHRTFQAFTSKPSKVTAISSVADVAALAAPGAAVSVRPQGPSWSGWSSQVLRTRRAGSSRI